jgi:hypothetical protein
MDKTLIMQLAREAGFHPLQGGLVEVNLLNFAKLVAEQAMKYGPCYQMGYADGEFAERERLTKLLQESGK